MTMAKTAPLTDSELRLRLGKIERSGKKLTPFAADFIRNWVSGTKRGRAFTAPARKFAQDLIKENGV